MDDYFLGFDQASFVWKLDFLNSESLNYEFLGSDFRTNFSTFPTRAAEFFEVAKSSHSAAESKGQEWTPSGWSFVFDSKRCLE